MNLRVTPIKDANVRVGVHGDGPDTVVTEFSGVLSHRDPTSLLQPFFKELHQAMVDGGARRVVVDVRELRFMNSASFKHFVTWIRANGALPPVKRYGIHFVLNPAHHWQEV